MKGEMRILSGEGDLKVIWDSEKEDEVEAAREQFDNLIEKGYRAFSVSKKGKKGKQMDEFDPEVGQLIMAPVIAGGKR